MQETSSAPELRYTHVTDPTPRSTLQRLYHATFLAVLAILPMSHTIALRNVLLGVLLVLLLVHLYLERHAVPTLLRRARPLPWALLAWCVFLLLFPFWAVHPQEAWANLRGQWMNSMFAWAIGFGAVWLLGPRGPGLWSLALASAFPLLVHLLVAGAAWAGLLGDQLPTFLSFKDAALRLAGLLPAGSLSWAGWQPFPLGFWGVEDMHGNLGYAACQAIVLFSVLLLSGWRQQQHRSALAALLAIGLSLASILVASSRGAFLYALLVMLLAALVHYVRLVPVLPSADQGRRPRRLGLLLAVLTVLAAVAALAFNAASRDLRWQTMADKVRIGLAQEDPAQLLCEGLSAEAEQKIRQAYSHRSPAYVDDLITGLKIQDGGRILLMRVGLDLVLENPRGQDGSRGSYKTLIEQKCGHLPHLTFAHLHQSWMDLALGLGWLGAGLFAWLLLSFARAGWRAIGPGEAGTWGYALLLMASFWFLRGFADSLYREHYLQMQGMLMAYLYGCIFLKPAQAGPGGQAIIAARNIR
jgi:hypothetical protein